MTLNPPKQQRTTGMLKNLLMYRLLIWNAVAASVVVWAWIKGHLGLIFSGDAAVFGGIMTVVFACGVVSLFVRASKVSQGLNDLKAGLPVNATKFAIKNAHIGYTGVVIATIGLIGNLAGMVMAVHGFSSLEAQASADRMALGMEVAFNTTLISLSLAVWTGINFQMLKTATSLLMVDARDAR